FGLLDLMRWVVSFVAALCFYQTVGKWLARVNDWTDVWNQPAAFILILVAVSLIFQLFANRLVKRLPKEVHRHPVNHVLGALPGLLNGLITAAIVSSLLFSAPVSDDFQEALRESAAANRLAGYTDNLETALTPIFAEPIKQTLNRRTIIEPDEHIDLPFKVEDSRPRPDLEAAMLEMVNRERAKAGLPPLAPDPELSEVGRQHSADMFARSYFAHNTPDNKTPFDRMKEANIRFLAAGENLALAPTLEIAHTGLMNSPGHRANILNTKYGRVGIGIMDGGRRGLMVSQEFRN
ncbi:MAG TPA: CvpA family protein, partial [Pyrinomonadaceae bacterium]